jgi:hypothetical protein
VPDRPDIHVRLAAVKFLFRHWLTLLTRVRRIPIALRVCFFQRARRHQPPHALFLALSRWSSLLKEGGTKTPNR